MKHTLLLIILIINSLLVFWLSNNGLSEIEDQLKWIEDGRAGLGVNYFKNYRDEHINKVDRELQSEKNKLQNIQILTILITSLYALALFITYRKKIDIKNFFKLKKYTGITVLLFTIILIVSINSLFYLFHISFDKFQIAIMDFEINTFGTLVFISPILFRIAC